MWWCGEGEGLADDNIDVETDGGGRVGSIMECQQTHNNYRKTVATGDSL